VPFVGARTRQNRTLINQTWRRIAWLGLAPKRGLTRDAIFSTHRLGRRPDAVFVRRVMRKKSENFQEKAGKSELTMVCVAVKFDRMVVVLPMPSYSLNSKMLRICRPCRTRGRALVVIAVQQMDLEDGQARTSVKDLRRKLRTSVAAVLRRTVGDCSRPKRPEGGPLAATDRMRALYV